MDQFVSEPWPCLLGASRKRFIHGVDETAGEAGDRLGGSLAAVASAYAQGVRLFRVHDVRETKQHLQILSAIENVS